MYAEKNHVIATSFFACLQPLKKNSGYAPGLPWTSNERPRDNINPALAAFSRTYSRLNSSGLYSPYDAQIKELLLNGHAEPCDSFSGYFIPHREVVKPDAESTKFRIVFDASFGGSRSLNNFL